MNRSEKDAVIIERLDQHRKETWRYFADLSLRWNELGNKRSSELSKQMFTIAALILPVSLVPVTQENFILLDNPTVKILLIFAWTCFVASLVFGMRHLSKEIKFFNDWADQEESRSHVFSVPIQTSGLPTATDVVNKMHDDSDALNKQSKIMSLKFLHWQMGTLIAGVIFIGFVLIFGLFLPIKSSSICLHAGSHQWENSKNTLFHQNRYWVPDCIHLK